MQKEVGETSKRKEARDPPCQKEDSAVKDGAHGMNKRTTSLALDWLMMKMDDSSQDSNDFEVIT